MKISLKVNLFKLQLNFIIFLICIKLLFSYLSVRLSYFQDNLISNFEKYNFFGLPEDFSNKIEFVLFPVLLFFVLYYYKQSKIVKNLVLISFVMYFLNIVTAVVNNVSLLDSLNFSLKIFTPVYLFCALIIYHVKTGNSLKPLLKRTIFFCLFLTLVAIVFFNPTFNRLQNYLPVYFDSIHTHNYILASIFIAISYFLYRSNKKISLVVFLVVSFLFLYYGYYIRTVLILYLMYVITMLYLVSDIFKVLYIKLLVFLPLFIVLGLLIASDIDLTQISSGRTSMYSDKLDQLSTFNFIEWVFGKGYGADLITTDIWWWDKKGAHSDLFTFLIENGLLFLFFFLYLYVTLIKALGKINLIYGVVIFGSFFSSIISNGISVRPAANYVFFIVLAYIYLDLSGKKVMAVN